MATFARKRSARSGKNARIYVRPAGDSRRPIDGPNLSGFGQVTDKVPARVKCICCGFVIHSSRREPKCCRCMQAEIFKELSA